MKLRDCNASHFIWSIKDGRVNKVLNIDINGRPSLMFKKLEDINRAADAENSPKFQNDYDGAEFNGNRAKAESTCLLFADRKTRSRDSYSIEDDKPEGLSDENIEEMTLTQLKKKWKTKKRKALEPVLLTPKREDDGFDLSEPLSIWRVKVSKSSKSKKICAKGSSLTSSRSTVCIKSKPITDFDDALLVSKDLFATVTDKADTPQLEYPECREMACVFDDSLSCNESVRFTASRLSFGTLNHDLRSKESRSLTNEGESCSANEVSLHDIDHIYSTSLVPPNGGERMELDNEEHMAKQPLVFPVSEFNEEQINHPPILSTLEVVSPVKDQSENPYDNAQSHTYLEMIPEESNHISGVQDLDSTIAKDDYGVDLGQVSDSYMDMDYVKGLPRSQEYVSPTPLPSYLCLPWKSHSWSVSNDDVGCVDANSLSTEEKQPLASVNIDTNMNSLNSDNSTVVLEDTSSDEEKLPFVPVNANSEVKVSDHKDQTDIVSEAPGLTDDHCIEPQKHPERLPVTRKAISPTSQEKLCFAMNSADVFENMEHFECKDKLCFGEQTMNKSSANGSKDEDNETNAYSQHATQVIQNVISLSPKQIAKKPKNDKKGSPSEKDPLSKANLDGPRLCRSLPRLSTGCNSIQVCSESAIAFSQRQMHDIESLALKLMTELNSMKHIVEEKLLFEAFRSTSMRNEADEVKSAIKTATKTEGTARKWLSMMARDCNRFCKIMKFTEGDSACLASSGSRVEENSLQRERKKISFADEAGGTLCDVRFFDNELGSSSQESMEQK